ncbi:MAG: DNA internalization-related competence protein ComEC/Rec2 [Syntrophobacteraceae bacterium]|nr:DNA internalization-related competence protein ComEC/Rec2 [Syntrophobacteraceae bacterium]
MPSRPLVWLTILFMLGISVDRLSGNRLPLPLPCLAAAAFVLLAAMASVLFFTGRRRGYDAPTRPPTASPAPAHRRIFIAPALLFFVFGMWASKAAAPHFPGQLKPFLDGRPACFMAEVCGAPEYYPEKIRVPLHLLRAMTGEGQTVLDGEIVLGMPAEDSSAPGVFLLPGDRVIFQAVLKGFHNFRNPGGFDYARYQAGKGLYGHFFLKKKGMLVKIAQEPAMSLGAACNAIRGRVELFRQKTLLWSKRSLDPGPAAFYAAMILGYKHLLDAKWEERIHQTGLYHLLSVSGLHIGMVCVFVFWLVRLVVRRLFPSVLNRVSDQRLALLPAFAAGIFYALLAGFGTPTIWRSILTLAMFFAASLRYRSVDSITMLALAALVILVADPAGLTQIPFQFTFTCVLAIIVIYPKFHRIRLSTLFPAFGRESLAGKIVSQFEDAFWVSIAINILLLPLVIYYFNGFSPAGVIANIFLLPYVGFVILPAGLLSVVLFALSETLAWPVIHVMNPLLEVCLSVIKFFAGFSWSFFWTGSFSPVWLILVYASLGLLFAPFPKKLKTAGLAAVAVLSTLVIAMNVGAAHRLQPGGMGALRVDVIDVGQGSSALIRFPCGQTMLIDGGGFPTGSYDIGSEVVAPLLWHESIRRLDYVALSHYHPDHALGLCFILRHFDVGQFWTSEISGDDYEATVTRRRLNEIASKQKIAIRTFPDLLKEVKIGSARVRLLHPGADFIEQASRKDLNDLSLVFEISFGKTRVILPGDIDSTIEKSIIPRIDKNRPTLLVAAHHGSRRSSCEEFLDALRPVAVVFSCGYENLFHFPAPVVLKRCAKRNIPIYRTDLQGDVRAVSDGSTWSLTTEVAKDGHADSLSRGCAW